MRRRWYAARTAQRTVLHLEENYETNPFNRTLTSQLDKSGNESSERAFF
jgi:hypothetical protein